MMSEIVIVECPICFDQIEGEKNKVTTECGHCFHTSCLMKNVAHNGFGCPYCRDAMAEEPADNNSDEEYDDFSVDDEEDEEPDYTDNVLRGSRWLFQRAEGEDLDDEEDTVLDEEEERVEVEPRAPVDYIVEKLVQRGVSMADLVKAVLIRDHDEYQFHDEFDRVDDELFGKFRAIISNYQPPAAVAVEDPVQVSLEEESSHHQSSRLRSHDSDELEEVVDKNDPNFQRFNQYCESYYSSERVSRYDRIAALVQEEKSSNKVPLSFQMKGSCVPLL
jgi:hypothetical protein